MSEDRNIEAVQGLFAAFQAKDMAGVRLLLADDVIFHIPGRSPISGDYRGFEQVTGFFRKAGELSGGTFKSEVKKILANGNTVMLLQHVTGQREGRSLDMDGAFVVRVEDGRWKEMWAFHFDEPQAHAFWS